MYARLMAAEVDPALAKDIVDRLEASMATDAFFFKATASREPMANRWKSLKFDARRLEAFVRAEMRQRPAISTRRFEGSVVAVVGSHRGRKDHQSDENRVRGSREDGRYGF